MFEPIHQKTTATLPLPNSFSRSPLRRGFLLIAPAIALALFALLPAPKAFGVSPAPDGGYPGNNTAEGTNALVSLTTGPNNTGIGAFALYNNTTGIDNTANGFAALFNNTTGNYNTADGVHALVNNTTANDNTAIGINALFANTTGHDNTANGFTALFANTTGNFNTANGVHALVSNTTGGENTAEGTNALFSNTTGNDNTANGFETLFSNTTGYFNTATGHSALYSNTTGYENTANGLSALVDNTTGHFNAANGFAALSQNTTGIQNTAIGWEALFSNTTGSNNIALGAAAGQNLTTGDYNIDIGNLGVAGDANTMRIGGDNQGATFIGGIYGRSVSGLAVVIDSSDHLGTVSSSRRFKKEIKPMGQSSGVILGLEPVMFQYKSDPSGTAQFGLIAEEVAKVDPDLVVRDAEGEPYTVRYEAVNAMLLNEFLKEHRKVEQLESKAQKQETMIARQQKQIEALTAGLQKVSAQLELNKPAPQLVVNNQ